MPAYQLKMNTVQYNAVLAITVAIKWILVENLYQELGLDSWKVRRWLRIYLKLLQLKRLPAFMEYFLPSKSRNVTELARNF